MRKHETMEIYGLNSNMWVNILLSILPICMDSYVIYDFLIILCFIPNTNGKVNSVVVYACDINVFS